MAKRSSRMVVQRRAGSGLTAAEIVILKGLAASGPKEYDATATYAANSMIVRGGIILRNPNAINTPEAYDSNHWTALT